MMQTKNWAHPATSEMIASALVRGGGADGGAPQPGAAGAEPGGGPGAPGGGGGVQSPVPVTPQSSHDAASGAPKGARDAVSAAPEARREPAGVPSGREADIPPSSEGDK